MRNEDRVVIITGAGQGIGKTIAAKFLDHGLRVVIAEKNAAAGRTAERELSSFGEVRFIATDVSSESSVKSVLSATLKNFGRLDVLINNAGAFHFKPLSQSTLKDWNAVIGTNLTGCFLMSKHAAPHLKKTRGSIVNISSTRALMSEPGKEAYAASKGGIVALTHALAISLGPSIRVNCISPDWIDTGDESLKSSDHRQFPAGRVGQPKDVAALAFFLTDPDNSFLTGSNVLLDGGLTRKMRYD